MKDLAENKLDDIDYDDLTMIDKIQIILIIW